MYKYRISKNLQEREAPESRIKFQEERIALFDEIENKLNNLYPLIDNAKEETIAFYKENPSSFSVNDSAKTIISYLEDIEELLKK